MSLEAKHLTVGYSGIPIITDVNVCLSPGELTVLIGANGSGKSTLLRTLVGAQPPLSGEVLIDNTPISCLSAAKLARKLAIVLTDRSGGGGLRVKEVVAIGRHPYSGFWGRLNADDRYAVEGALKDVGLESKAECYITELSDGERQKAMIARAIAQETPIIILDEPTSFLDVASRFDIISLLSNLAHTHHKAILLSSHDTAAAFPVADRIWAVADGTLRSGTVQDLASNRTLDSIFYNISFDSQTLDFRPSSK